MLESSSSSSSSSSSKILNLDSSKLGKKKNEG
jgi:hypothetical protein